MEMKLSNPNQMYKLGTILVVLGVLVWAPFFALRIAGETPSIFIYLPFHLVGVIGGGSLRKVANHKLAKPKEDRNIFKWIAHILFVVSLLVWLPYYAQKLMGSSVELTPYLTAHLIAVLSGTSIIIFGSAWRLIRMKRRE
jgi:Na+/H+ antiporter NhaD/arsenite permease-like protein